MLDSFKNDGLGRHPNLLIDHVGNSDQVRRRIQKERHPGHLTVAVQAHKGIAIRLL